MSDDDLSRIQKQINESRRGFLDAVNGYKATDSEKVMKDFVSEFLNENKDFADTTREHANEVLEQDRGFARVTASISETIEVAGMTLNQCIYKIINKFIEQALHVFDPPPGITPGSIEWLTAQRKLIDGRRKALDAAGKKARQNAYDMGVYIDALQRKATALVLLRTLTIKAFKLKNLQINLKDIIEKLKEEIKEEGISEGLRETAHILADNLREVAHLGGTYVPILKILILAVDIKKFGDKKKPHPDPTNELLKLVDLMKKENAAYETLNEAYEKAIAELERLANEPLAQAS